MKWVITISIIFCSSSVFGDNNPFKDYVDSRPDSFLMDHNKYLMNEKPSLFTIGLLRLNMWLDQLEVTLMEEKENYLYKYKLSAFATYDKKIKKIIVYSRIDRINKPNALLPGGIVESRDKIAAGNLKNKISSELKYHLGLSKETKRNPIESNDKLGYYGSVSILGNMFTNIDEPYPNVSGRYIFDIIEIKLPTIYFDGGYLDCKSTLNDVSIYCSEK